VALKRGDIKKAWGGGRRVVGLNGFKALVCGYSSVVVVDGACVRDCREM
jgi:hypothetical protein